MYRTIHFFHPDWNNLLAFNVHENFGVYDTLAYVNQLGYIPYHPKGYALALRGQWLTDNYSIGALGLQSNEVIVIVPLETRENGKESRVVTPKFKGRMDGGFANPEVKNQIQQQAPLVQEVNLDRSLKNTFLDWIRNLLR